MIRTIAIALHTPWTAFLTIALAALALVGALEASMGWM